MLKDYHTADYFGALPNLAARVMGSAAYGQTLLEASTKLPVDWTVPFPALPLDPGGSAPCPGHLCICPPTPIAADGYVGIKLLGRFALKGVPGLAVLAEALPQQLRKRSFPMPAGLVELCPPDCVPGQSVSAEVKAHNKASSFARASNSPGLPSPSSPEMTNATKSRRASFSASRRASFSHTVRTMGMSRRASQLLASDQERPSIVVVAYGAESATPSPAHERC